MRCGLPSVARIGLVSFAGILWTELSALPVFGQTVVPTPPLIELLTPSTDIYTPEIEIVTPQEGEVLTSNLVSLQIDARRFPLGFDPDTELGLHIKIIVDNLDPVPVYNIDEPIEIELPPGTHTIRVIGSRPWDQAYRNIPAFDHVTFSIVEPTDENDPVFAVGNALLTVTSPASGTYGAEPILLDYVVDGVNLGGAQVRYTLNDVSETTTDRGPLYLTGWQAGDNILTVELVGRDGNMLPNQGTTYNRVDRFITYEPDGDDTLSQLVRGEVEPEDVADILGPDPFIYDEDGRVQRLK